MSVGRFNSFPSPSNVLTPPWVEQYLYHLDRTITRAESVMLRQSYNDPHHWPSFLVKHKVRLTEMRRLQHKEMRYALYQVGHPLWQRIQ